MLGQAQGKISISLSVWTSPGLKNVAMQTSSTQLPYFGGLKYVLSFSKNSFKMTFVFLVETVEN